MTIHYRNRLKRHLVGLAILMVAHPLRADTPELDWPVFRKNCLSLTRRLTGLATPLDAATVKRVRELAGSPAVDPDTRAEQIQRLLDRGSLIVVTINPESRVKAARGLAAAELSQGQERVFLIKVQNEAGVTHRLSVSAPQLRGGKQTGAVPWLRAEIESASTPSGELTGNRVEYLLLRLTASDAGKREAVFSFDVGQGTQDLGFRAETPVLFAVQPKQIP